MVDLSVSFGPGQGFVCLVIMAKEQARLRRIRCCKSRGKVAPAAAAAAVVPLPPSLPPLQQFIVTVAFQAS